MHVVLAHGASGSAAAMGAHVVGLERRGVTATAIDLPLRKAEAAVSVYRERTLDLGEGTRLQIVGGQSYGGRVASLLVAGHPDAYAGLVCFSYPLHRPGQPDWEMRSAHWLDVTVPVLLLSGEADPFARLDLLRRASTERLRHVRLVTYPRLGHDLRPVLEDALDRVAEFVRQVASASP
jgi:uncharacterized protein